MYESEFQEVVTDTLLDSNGDGATAELTENENAIVVSIANRDAAYTANEARQLAEAIKQRTSTPSMAAYLIDLADVVDGNKTLDSIKNQWKDRKINPEYPNRNEH